MIAKEIIAIVIGYLLGSIPSAYIAASWVKGKDIRQLGGGNIGGLNTFREVGVRAGIAVAVADIGKGAVAVAIAYWLLAVPQLFVLLAGLAAIVGHMWMFTLKFSGGKGMGTTVGILCILMPIYGYWHGLLIFLGIYLIVIIITRNVALSSAVVLFSLPFIAWLGVESGFFSPFFIVWSVITGIIISLKFLPTAKAALARAESKRDFIFDRWRRDKR